MPAAVSASIVGLLEHAAGKGLKAVTGKKLWAVPELEERLIPVRIPVDKDLGGYCVLLVRREDRHRFEGVRSVSDLRRFKIGLGYGWIDVDILRANGFEVVTGSSYEGLFEMLVHRRFDGFRAAQLHGHVQVGPRHAELGEMREH